MSDVVASSDLVEQKLAEVVLLRVVTLHPSRWMDCGRHLVAHLDLLVVPLVGCLLFFVGSWLQFVRFLVKRHRCPMSSVLKVWNQKSHLLQSCSLSCYIPDPLGHHHAADC